MTNKANRNIFSKQNKNEKLSVIIAAAGPSKGMKVKKLKSIFSLESGKTIVERQIDLIHYHYPKADIVIVGGFDYDKLREKTRKCQVRLVENNRYAKTNVMESVKIGLDACLESPILIMHGDLVFGTHLLANITTKTSSVLVDENNPRLKKTEVGVNQHDGYITSMVYGIKEKWGQMAYLRDKEVGMLRDIVVSQDVSKWFLHDCINHIIDEGGKIAANCQHSTSLVDVDSYHDIRKIGAKI